MTDETRKKSKAFHVADDSEPKQSRTTKLDIKKKGKERREEKKENRCEE